jgi:hypothetical protein
MVSSREDDGAVAEEEGFKVTDRRRRASDDDADQVRPDPTLRSRAPEPDLPSVRSESASESATRPFAPGMPPASGLDLRSVFAMFAGSALMALGEAADPLTGERHLDLDQAQEAIDVLMLLRDKTEGNRSPDETALLEEILYDLQVRFVRAASPPTPGGPSR